MKRPQQDNTEPDNLLREQLLANGRCLWDFTTDEALIVVYLLMTPVEGGLEDGTYYVSVNQCRQFVALHMEDVIGQHEQLLQNYDAAYPYVYDGKEFDKALKSLCERTGWAFERETSRLSLKPAKGLPR